VADLVEFADKDAEQFAFAFEFHSDNPFSPWQFADEATEPRNRSVQYHHRK
jgi:hypothetical protein